MESTTTPTTKTSEEEGETSRYFSRRTEISGVWPFSSSNQGSKSNSTKSNKTPDISSSATSVHSSASGSSSVYQRTPFRFQKITSDSATTLASNLTSSNSYCTETRTATDSRTEFLSELSRLVFTAVTLSWKMLCLDFSIFSIPKRRTFLNTPTSTTYSRESGTPRHHKSANQSSSSFYGDVDSSCYVAVIEGRGKARGEVGLACISLNSPNLIICQFSDSR